MRLWGTITGSNISAYAIIEDTTTRRQKLSKKSDEIKNGLTAIIYAALGGHAENVACLIAAGADINAKSKSGETALKFAEMSDRKDIIDLLKENGAKE